MGRLTIRIDGEAYIEKVANKYCEDVCSSRNRCNDCPIRDAFNKLAHYEDLEERIEKLFDGKISLNEAVEEIEKKVHGEEVFRYSRILTNAEAEKWDKWLDLEEQGRLIELPCKVGDVLYKITHPWKQLPKVTKYRVKNFKTIKNGQKLQIEVQADSSPCKSWANFENFYTTKEEAEAKLKELKEGVE